MLVDVMVDYKHLGRFRHNLHCVKHFDYTFSTDHVSYQKKAKLKPDVEMITLNGWILSVEIDTGTERFDKLVEKFSNSPLL